MSERDRFGCLSSALLADSCDRCCSLPHWIHSEVDGGVAIGPAFTFEFEPGDNLAVHLAVAAAPPGSVLVGACYSPADVGVFGAILATAARNAGLAGLVTDALIRDRSDLVSAGFPVFASGRSPCKATKHNPGRLEVTVAFGPQRVSPDDLVCADDDGIVVVPSHQIGAILQRAWELKDWERTVISRLMSGENTLQALEINPDERKT